MENLPFDPAGRPSSTTPPRMEALAVTNGSTRHEQIYTRDFHTASARVEEAQCAKVNAAVQVRVETKGLILERDESILRRSCSEGQLSGSKTVGARDGNGQETIRFLSSDLYR